MYRENAGVINEPQLLQDVETPEGFLYNGIAGRAIADDGAPAKIFQNPLGPFRILSKLLAAHHLDPPVSITVGRDFMALLLDGQNQLGVSLRDPTQYEEGRFHFVKIQKLQ